MKKVPVTEQAQESEKTISLGSTPSSATAAQRSESEDRDLALRSQADFENYKKRCAREKEDAVKYANSSLLERLVAIVDNFELGLEAARDESERSPIYSGMTLVLKQLRDFLAENGLQAIEAEGKKFDPNLHEAIAHEPSRFSEGTVVRQTRRGYRFKDRLLRPSSVVVSSGPAS